MSRLRPNRTRGQALTEFALIVPIFALLLFGIIDLGRFVYTQNALNQVAREAARVGAVNDRPTCTATGRAACVQEIVTDRLEGVVGGVTYEPDHGCYAVHPLTGAITKRGSVDACQVNDLLKVELSNQFTLVTPLIAQWVGGIDIRGEAQVKVH
jgi:Flp pilus assembly protein TadG